MTGKRYNGAPFGIQTRRFDVSGVHPQNKMPGTYTEVPYCKKATSKENKLLGPGTYTIESGDFTPRTVNVRARGPNWKRAYELAKIHAIPHMLYRDKWEHQKELVRQMGPGMYDFKDFIQIFNEKPSSRRGVCEMLDSRFSRKDKFHTNLPGPGAYGKGGIPSAMAYEKRNEGVGQLGILNSCGRENLQKRISVGSGLAPCRYMQPSSINKMLNKVVSLRGPYDVFSGDRYGLPREVLEKTHLGPGKYEIQSFTDKQKDEHHRKHGTISTMVRYPEHPSDRVYTILSQCPRNKTDPGPGHYDAEINCAPESSKSKQPFHSSAKRFNKRADVYFTGNANPVGVGQYDIIHWHHCRHSNGYEGVFKSNTPRLPIKVDSPGELLLHERIKSKWISLSRRLFNPILVEVPS